MANFIGNKWKDLKNQTGSLKLEKLRQLKACAWPVIAFIFFLLLSLLIIQNYLQRRAIINHFKIEMHYVIKSLNNGGWDLAYDEVDFNSLYPFSLVTFKNLKIYSLNQNYGWEINRLELNSGLLNSTKLSIELGAEQNLTVRNKPHKVSLGNYNFKIELPINRQPNNLTLQLQNVSISEFAEISEINLAARIIAPQLISEQSPSLRGYLDIHKVKLNGLLNYPLGQNIERIYLNAELLGQIKGGVNFQQALREWLSKDGHIEIKDFNLNWPPLLMVGKGNLYFNENFKPILQLNTSSKALFELINDLENKNWVDNKGAFVIKILLGNKAYKADAEDKYLTVTTPIAVRDDALLVEKIVLKNFKNTR